MKKILLLTVLPLIALANTPKIGGKLQLDYTKNSLPDGETSSLSGAQIRRARVKVSGKFPDDYFYKLEVDYSGSAIKMKSSYIGKEVFPKFKTYLGYQSLSTSLGDRISSSSLIFPERSGLNRIIGSSKRLGVISQYRSDNYWLQIGAQEQKNSDVEDPIREENLGLSLGGLSKSNGSKLHHSIGVFRLTRTGNETASSSSKSTYKLRLKGGGSDLTDVYSSDTGDVTDIKYQQVVFVDTFFLYKSFYIGAEATRITWEKKSVNLYHNTWMVETSYLFGDSFRKYKKGGSLSSPVLNKKGAYEIALRYEYFNLTNGVDRSKQRDIGVSLNYFANKNIYYMLGLQKSVTGEKSRYKSMIFRGGLNF